MSRHAWILILAQCCFFPCVCAAVPLSAQNIADRVGFDQHLSAVVPSDLRFRDETGSAVSIGDYRGTAPIVLVFSYFGCSTLCPTFIAHLVQMLEQTDLTPGRQYMVLVVSIDPHDSPALAHSKKAVYFEQATQRNNAGAWHLLTGSHGDIASLTAAAGFRYFFDVDSHQYAHPAGVVVLTPEGVIAQYLFGFEFKSADLKTALSAAAVERVSSPVQRLLLLCFHFDPVNGKYSGIVMSALRWTAVAMVTFLLAWLVRISRMRRTKGDPYVK